MLRDTLASFLEWVQSIGPWGAVLYAVAYVPAAVLFVPGSLLTLGAGFVFGLAKGTVIVSLGSTAGAAAAFIVARSVAHDWVARRVARRPALAAIGRAVETEGFKIVLLTRLSPVFPFNLLNYAYGLTSVRFSTYLLASWIGMLPGTIMYVYLGSAANSLAAVVSGETPRSAGQQALFVLGLVATVAVAIIVTRRARRTLNEMVTPRGQRDDDEPQSSSSR
ncbi:MAG: TVP38/TMEM64 family protein [Vicinamibacterales bacterium]